MPPGFEAWLGAVFTQIGQPERSVEWCRAELAQQSRHPRIEQGSAGDGAMTMAGSREAAMAAAKGLIEAAEATGNPHVLAFTLLAYGMAHCDADPLGARDAMRRGLAIAQDSGNRYDESHLANVWADSRPDTATRWTRSITSLWRSAITATLATPPLSASPWRCSRPCSTGSDATNLRPPSPVSRSVPSRHRASPSSTPRSPTCAMSSATQTYESLARKGETMTTAAMVTYAYDQIDQARTELEHPS